MRVLAMCVLVAVAASPAMAAFVENFSYADGALTGVSGGLWQAWGQPQSDIGVVNGELKVRGNDDQVNYEDVWAWVDGLGETGDGLTATIKIKAGQGASNMWYLHFGQSVTGDLGFWYGGGTMARSRGPSGVSPAAKTLTGGWDELKAVFNFTAGKTDFYFNGVYDWTTTWSGKSALNIIEFQRYGRTETAGDYVLFDNLVVPEPASLILLVLGGLVLRRRRA